MYSFHEVEMSWLSVLFLLKVDIMAPSRLVSCLMIHLMANVVFMSTVCRYHDAFMASVMSHDAPHGYSVIFMSTVCRCHSTFMADVMFMCTEGRYHGILTASVMFHEFQFLGILMASVMSFLYYGGQ